MTAKNEKKTKNNSRIIWGYLKQNKVEIQKERIEYVIKAV